MNPDHTEVIKRAGLTQKMQTELAKRATISVGTMRSINPTLFAQGITADDKGRSARPRMKISFNRYDPSYLISGRRSGLYTMVMLMVRWSPPQRHRSF